MMQNKAKMALAISTDLMSGDVLKFVYTVTVICDGTYKKWNLTTNPHGNSLVQIQFNWTYCNKIVKEFTFDCSYSLRRYPLHDKHTTIEMNVSSDKLVYSKIGIFPTECWSEWQFMGKIPGKLVAGATKTYYASCDFHVTAQTVKTDMIFTKFYSDEDFTDFRLSTSDGSIGVHKACLAAHSDVFKRMLSGEWTETAEGIINMKGVNLETLQHLKDYMYLGTVPNEGLKSLLLLARCYLLEDLKKQCIRKLAQTTPAEDLFSLLKFACENNIPELIYTTLQLTRDSVSSSAYLIKKYKRS